MSYVAKIRPKLVEQDMIRSAFQVTGLSPLDRQKVLDRCQELVQERQITSHEPELPESLESLETLQSPIPKSFELLDLDITADIASIAGENPSDAQKANTQNFLNKLQILQESHEAQSRFYEERIQLLREKFEALEGEYHLLLYKHRDLQGTNEELRENLEIR